MNDHTMMADQNINEFLDALSSGSPVPGGGGASALVGAVGMSLGTMVANLTTGKKKYAEYQQEIEELIDRTQIITAELTEFMDKDARSFEPLSKAYGLPRSTPQEIEHRDEIMEHALVVASEAPLELMKKLLEAMHMLDRLSIIGSKIAISDIGVGVQMVKAALNGASLNIFINTRLMKNREVADKMNFQADKMLLEGNELAEKVFDEVTDQIR